MANNTTSKRAAIVTGTLGVAVLLGWIYLAWGKPPQMGPEDDVFTAVDALFTAVTAHDERLLDQCTRRLQGLSDAGKLPKEASSYLDGIIAKARGGRWQASAEKLYGFMLAQRRDGAVHAPTRHKQHGQAVAHRR